MKEKRAKALSKTFRVLQAMAKYGLRSPSDIAKKLELDASDVVNYLNRLRAYGYIIKQGEGDYEISDKLTAKYLESG